MTFSIEKEHCSQSLKMKTNRPENGTRCDPGTRYWLHGKAPSVQSEGAHRHIYLQRNITGERHRLRLQLLELLQASVVRVEWCMPARNA